MYRFGIFGCGRIGAMHAGLVARHPEAAVSWCFDVDRIRAEQTAACVGARVAERVEDVLDAGDVDAVLIAAPTNLHVDLIVKSARAGKPMLCEKPIDVDLARVEACREQLKDHKVPVQIGFNRRFDPGHNAVQRAVRNGEVGQLEMLLITSRDPAPPPREYLQACGGLFRDTTIHDFDMARFVLGEEPVEVFATASNLVDPVFGELGDVDTAMVTLRTASGALCHINNSRRAVYGHDQRLEAFGSAGMVKSENRRPFEISRSDKDGTERHAPYLHFFIERYKDAYEAQIGDFVDCLRTGRQPSVSFEDGRRALILAELALRSWREGRPVPVHY